MTHDPDALELVNALLHLARSQPIVNKRTTEVLFGAAAMIERLTQPPEARRELAREALTMARDTLLFMHEMGGYVPENVRTAIHSIDVALGNKTTELRCVTDHVGAE